MTVLPAPGSRLRWAVTDSGTLARRYLAHLAHQPEQVVLTVGFPILILVIFVYLLGGMVVVPGGDYRQLLVPGMATMTMLSGVGSTMVAVVTDAQRGITDRLRSLPMAGAAVLAGRALADLAISAIGLVVLLLAGLAIGWRPSAGPLEVAAAVGVLLLLRFALLWVGIYLGLIARGTGPVTAAQALEFPVAFLSGVFVSPAAMPAVVATLAEWNPLPGDRRGRPGAVRQPRLGRRLVGRAARRPRGRRLAASDHRGLRAAVRPPLPGDEPMTARK
ncbi:MAG TPA: ABC transporter permease, partial [Pseudonocardia sp.]|uniref:ABC transporter permease n=1 Tax=Pseudonocardia sp. TaxID=60912 RepID=UPI002B4AB6F7